jgi:hypothetical protein
MEEQNKTEEEIIHKIKKLHKKLENITNKKYQIIIKSSTNENIVIGNFEKKKQYKVYNMPKLTDLEDTYDSLEELNDIFNEYCKIKKIKNLFKININDGNILYCKDRFELIGKISII